jgi:hypothetical protein
MKKINYPTDSNLLDEFHKRYYGIFSAKTIDDIDVQLGKAPVFNNQTLTFEKIATSNFEELCKLKAHLKPFSDSKANKGKARKGTKNSFTKPFDYKGLQSSIAGFFMNEKQLGMKTCYYCGIDFINSFKDIADYQNVNDFINRAPASELKIIDGLGDVMAAKILLLRATNYITSFTKFTSSKKVIAALNKFDSYNTHNHFTLDHILPQGDFKFLSLCLYNLVPSCYSCNAKFKKDINFLDDKSILEVSPTSEQYRLAGDLKFKLLYNGKLKDIKNTSDFILTRDIRKNVDQVEKYLEIFKLDGRYAIHKDIILKLIETKINYPYWKIRLLSREMRKSLKETKELIYGKEIFDAGSNAPLHKLKRDIAKALKII